MPQEALRVSQFVLVPTVGRSYDRKQVVELDGKIARLEDEHSIEWRPEWHPVADLIPIEPWHHYVTALWAGGWDSYLVDGMNCRQATENEVPKPGIHPTTKDGYLLGFFVKNKNICGEGQCIKVLRRLGGGD